MNRMPRTGVIRRRLIVIGLASLLAALCATSVAAGQRAGASAAPTSAASAASAAPAALWPALGAVTIPQVSCPTTYGLPTSPPPVASSAIVAIPTALRAVLVAYANDVAALLAPPGWTCKAAVGADGSWVVTITNRHAVITASGADACYGCAIDIAAPYFPQAARLGLELCGKPCSPATPTGTISEKLANDVVYFENPATAHVPYRTRGVSAFDYSASSGASALSARCAVPGNSVYLCQPILSAFLTTFAVKATW